MGDKSPLVRLAEWLEKKTGQSAFAHLFVTHAMMARLNLKWELKGRKLVLHDRPPTHFRKATIEETHNLMKTLAFKLKPDLISDGFFKKFELPNTTPFTGIVPLNSVWNYSSVDGGSRRDSESMELRPESPSNRYSPRNPISNQAGHGNSKSELVSILRDDRPALVVSSTSWTADEDFGLLLRAAGLYEKRAREVNSSPSRTNSSPEYKDPNDGRSSRNSYRNSPHISAPPPSSSPPPPPFSDSPTTSNNSNNPFSHSPSHSSSSSFGGLNASEARERQERNKGRRPSLGALRTPTLLPNEPASKLPKMLIIVTGKGELKERYEREIQRLEIEEKWQWVRIRTVWLESEEYPVLLGSADVGISLHTSSSGLDLPMKVVDMLGCSLPVCALDFSCLDELIQDGKNGLIFRDAEGLARQLESLLATHPERNWLGKEMKEPFDILGWNGSSSNNNSPSASPRLNSRDLDYGNSYSSPNSPISTTAPFSLLSSPILSPQKDISRPRNPSSTWSGNWKKVVRPLLQAEDVPSSPMVSKFHSNPNSRHSRITSGTALLKTLVLGESLVDEPRTSGEILNNWNEDEENEDGDGDESRDRWNSETATGREGGGKSTKVKLRHRRSIKRHGTGSSVPEISVSPAAG